MALNLASDSITTPLSITQPPFPDIPFFLTSSLPPPAILRSQNRAFLISLETSTLDQQSMNHVRHLSGMSEALQVETHILSKELNEIKAINAKRKERASGKRLILKGKFVVSMEDIQKALEKAEKVTLAKQMQEQNTTPVTWCLQEPPEQPLRVEFS